MNERLRTQSQLMFPILQPLLKVLNIVTLIVMTTALLEPIKLCLSVWFGPTADQGTGIVAIIGAVVIAIRCNQQADIVRKELSELFPSPDAPQRRGLRWPLIVGILLILFSVLAAAPTISYLSMVWLLFAQVFWTEGLFVAGKYRAAFAFALLATPIPQGIYRNWIDATSQLAALLASQLGNIVGTKSFVTTNGIIVNENTFTISFRSGVSPHPTLWLTALICITWLIWMKKTFKESLFWSVVAIFIAFVLHVARLVLIIVGARISVTLGNIILFIPWWTSTGLALVITAIIRRVWRIRKDRLNRFIVEGQANQWK
ncbi:MAG: hypothetical protein RJB05_141 [Armatimonadota bacterium]